MQICGRHAILSQNIEDISSTLGKMSRHVSLNYMQVLESHSKMDIEAFITKDNQEDFEYLTLKPEVLGNVFQTLSDGAHGMFLWVKLMIDRLKECATVTKIKHALDNLSDGLDKMYEDVLQQTEDKETAKELLQWITYATRPLTVTDLDHAVTIGPGQIELDSDDFMLKSRETFRQILGPLINIDDKSKTIKFSHASVKDLLIGGASRSGSVSSFIDTTVEAH